MNWTTARTEWLRHLRTADASPETIRLRRYQLMRIADGMPPNPWSVTARQLEEWFSVQPWSRETRRSYLAAVRSFYRWAISHDLTGVDPTTRLPRIPPARALPRPATERAIDKALERADDRQHLMIMLASRHGLRRGEIARINTGDMVESIRGGWQLRVHGKGGKDRVLPLFPDAARVILEQEPGWLFPNGKGSHLTPGHVGVLITRALPVGVTPHQLRHRFATVVYRRTKDILNLQELLGHASVATTQRYAAPDEDEVRAVLMSAA